MSMVHALEVRVPFFDYRLVEYVLSLSDALKYPHTPKQLLTEALGPRIPPEVIHRKKMGFTLPMDQWLRHELAPLAQRKLLYLADRKEFNGKEVLLKWNEFQQGHPGILWSRIWNLVVLSDWMERNQL
jgi:asparagine synthase (glutamine-hydrolysing)